MVCFGTLSFNISLKGKLFFVPVWLALLSGADRIKRIWCVFGLLGYYDPVQADGREIAKMCWNIGTDQEQRHSEVVEYGWLNWLGWHVL